MSTALTLVIVLLVLLLMLLAVALLMYYLTQQDLKNLSVRLQSLSSLSPAAQFRSPETVRRERAVALDKLLVAEAGLSVQPRDVLTDEELALFEESRLVIKRCNAELKQLQDWLGLPYDLEWGQLKERIPRLDALYRQAVLAELGEPLPPQS